MFPAAGTELQPPGKMHGIEASQAVKSIKVTFEVVLLCVHWSHARLMIAQDRRDYKMAWCGTRRCALQAVVRHALQQASLGLGAWVTSAVY